MAYQTQRIIAVTFVLVLFVAVVGLWYFQLERFVPLIGLIVSGGSIGLSLYRAYRARSVAAMRAILATLCLLGGLFVLSLVEGMRSIALALLMAWLSFVIVRVVYVGYRAKRIPLNFVVFAALAPFLLMGMLMAFSAIGAMQSMRSLAVLTTPGARSALVEADLFSGRPNPTWSLAPDALQSLQDDLASLPPRSSPATSFDGLGYRGLIVRLTDEQRRDTAMISVYHDTVRVERGGMTMVYEDSARRVEQGLVQSARQQAPADIYAILVSATR